MLNRPLGYFDFGGNCLCLIDHWDTLTLAVSLLVLNRPLGYLDFGGNCLCLIDHWDTLTLAVTACA